MKHSTANLREPSPAFASLLPFSVGIEIPIEVPKVVVIDSPIEWGIPLLMLWLMARYSRRE